MDVIAGLGIGALVLAFIAGMAAIVTDTSTRRRGRQAPAPGDSRRVSAEQARYYYRVAQDAVRVLDQLRQDDMTRVVIPESTIEKIDAISARFYK